MKSKYNWMTGRDALAMESDLRRELGEFLSFDKCEIFFSEADFDSPMIHDRDGGRLILPLGFGRDIRPALLVHGVRVEEMDRFRNILPRLANLCFEKLCLEKAASMDEKAGLFSEDSLFEFLENRIGDARNAFSDPGRSISGAGVGAGMIAIDWPSARQIAEEFDYDFKNRVFYGMAKALRSVLPESAIAATLGKNEGLHEFGVAFPASGRGKCHLLARELVNAMESMLFRDKLTRLDYRPRLTAGHAIYPQDMTGDELALPMDEQVMRLRDRARFASGTAISVPGRIAGFVKILQRGGRVIETLADGALKVNLGRVAGAREGARFEIRDASGNARKGELILLSVGLKNSVAELTSIDNPADPPALGDKLSYIDPRRISLSSQDKETSGKTKIVARGEFFALFEDARRTCDKFVFSAFKKTGGDTSNTPDEFMEAFLDTTRRETPDLAPEIAGRGGNGAHIFFHKNAGSKEVAEFFRKMSDFALGEGMETACGIFAWPFLNFPASECEARAFQALEYGELSPPPHIGVFDSVALTIGADRKFSRGDIFGAIEDYKLALISSPDNAMARNSLGVCLASLGKLEDARTLCLEALARTDDASLKSQIAYNLGTIFDKLNDQRKARKYYRECLKHDPAHVYAGVRLGKMYEGRGRFSLAGKLYESSARRAGDNSELLNLAERYLANLKLSRDGIKEGRDLLYNNISRDPSDAASLAMLARTYLRENGDPALAELFARKSANLSGARESWLLLAEALEARDLPVEAEKARERARKASKLWRMDPLIDNR